MVGRGMVPPPLKLWGAACDTPDQTNRMTSLVDFARVSTLCHPYARARARRASRRRAEAKAIIGNKATANQSPLLKLCLQRVRSERTSTRQQLDCAKTL